MLAQVKQAELDYRGNMIFCLGDNPWRDMMISSNLNPGMSLFFDAPLARGSGHVETGEFVKSSQATGSIVPTPPADWDSLKEILSLPERSARLQASNFDVAYVPYTDGRIHYHEGNGAVISAEFSGCLMAVYSAGNMRRVAHVPKSNSIDNDCVGEFRDYFIAHSTLVPDKKAQHVKEGHQLVHYFQPFAEKRDVDVQVDLIQKLMVKGFITQPSYFTVFGLVSAVDNKCTSFWAVKPKTQPRGGEMWHIVFVRDRANVLDFRTLIDKKNRAAR